MQGGTKHHCAGVSQGAIVSSECACVLYSVHHVMRDLHIPVCSATKVSTRR